MMSVMLFAALAVVLAIVVGFCVVGLMFLVGAGMAETADLGIKAADHVYKSVDEGARHDR